MLHASASAPVLHCDGGPYAHSERVERRVPPLALVPLHQLQQQRKKAEEKDEVQRRKSFDSDHHTKPTPRKRCAHKGNGKEQEEQLRQEEQQRLGERFLGMMALLSRLTRMNLNKSDAPTKNHQQRNGRQPAPHASPKHQLPNPPSSAFDKLVEKKKQERSSYVAGGGARGDEAIRATISLSPHRKPDPVVNVATAPLREHLTFEISMLLPPPMDTRQSALQSPIHRKKRKKRLKKRRRRRRLTGAIVVDGKRTWQTSHATWVPHASTDYAQAREAQGMAATTGSKLAAKFAALRTTAAPAPAVGLPSSAQRMVYRYTAHTRDRPLMKQRVESINDDEQEEGIIPGQEEEAEDDDSEQNRSDSLKEDDEDRETDEDEVDEDDHSEGVEESDVLPTLHSSASSVALERPLLASIRPPLPRPVQTHQAAWISPELRTWLLHTNLFRTTSTPNSS